MATHDFIDILSGERRGVFASLVRGAAGRVEPLYRSAVERRNAQFDEGRRPAVRLPRPVISVGNLTTGGTGKTPMVVEFCRMLHEADRRPGVLLRGYAGTGHDDSDETAELRHQLQGIGHVQADAKRSRGAEKLLDQHPQVDVFVLDDGFQHRQVARDLDVVLIDATCPWGYGHVLPRGLLREPKASIQRADCVIITRADQVQTQVVEEVNAEVAELRGKPAEAQSAARWKRLLTDMPGEAEQSELPIEHLEDKRVLGVCGIGNPAAFEQMLRQHTGHVSDLLRFDDHYAYRESDIQSIQSQARQRGAHAIVMTQKDYVKWQAALPNPTLRRRNWLPVIRPALSVHWLAGHETIRQRIDAALESFVAPEITSPQADSPAKQEPEHGR